MSSNISYDEPVINWGPWSRLPNGQWHREGQDSLGNWYEDNRDVDPRVPRSQPGEVYDDLSGNFGDMTIDSSSNDYPYQEQDPVYGGYNQATTGQHSQGTVTSDNYPRSSETETRHKGKSRHHENAEQSESSRRAHDRSKGSRSSKGDIKGSGYTSSRRKTDTKVKGRETEQQPATASSSKHHRSDVLQPADDTPHMAPPGDKYASMGAEGMAQQFPQSYASMSPQNVDQLDDDSVPGLQQRLDDTRNMYSSGPSMAPSSSSAMLNQGYGLPGDEAEEFDEDRLGELPTNLPKRGSYSSRPPKNKGVATDEGYNEDLSQYVVHNSRDFTFGTVFKIMWSEPMGNSRLSRHNKDPVGTGTSISEFGKRDYNGTLLYEGIRRFIVIDGNENGARNGNSICVPIATYKKQGCTKHGVKPIQHGVIHTDDKPPMLLNNEPDLGVAPIRLVVNRHLEGFEKLAPESRINYSKHVTIEHNAPVFIIGRIHQEDRETLGNGVDINWEKRIRDRKKDKKQERSRR